MFILAGCAPEGVCQLTLRQVVTEHGAPHSGQMYAFGMTEAECETRMSHPLVFDQDSIDTNSPLHSWYEEEEHVEGLPQSYHSCPGRDDLDVHCNSGCSEGDSRVRALCDAAVDVVNNTQPQSDGDGGDMGEGGDGPDYSGCSDVVECASGCVWTANQEPNGWVISVLDATCTENSGCHRINQFRSEKPTETVGCTVCDDLGGDVCAVTDPFYLCEFDFSCAD